jgi:DNA-binding response OmpR family regulator
MANASKLGDLLLRAKLIDERQLETAIDYQNARGGKLGEILVSLGYVSEAELLRLLSQQLQLVLVDEQNAIDLEIPEDARSALPRFLAEEELIFPLQIDREHKQLTIVTHEPLDDNTLEGIRIFANVEHVKIQLTTKAAMRKLLAKHLPHKPAAGAPQAERPADTGEPQQRAPLRPSTPQPAPPPAPPASSAGPTTLPMMPRATFAAEPRDPARAHVERTPPEPSTTPTPAPDRPAPAPKRHAMDSLEAIVFEETTPTKVTVTAVPSSRPPPVPQEEDEEEPHLTGWDDAPSADAILAKLGGTSAPPSAQREEFRSTASTGQYGSASRMVASSAPSPKEQARAEDDRPSSTDPLMGAVRAPARPTDQRRVLLVEADAKFRENVAQSLARQGHQVVQATSAADVSLQGDFVCDDLLIRNPTSGEAIALAEKLRRQNPYLDVRDVVAFSGAVTGSTIDPGRLFQFFFELWDFALRGLDAQVAAERRRARMRAEIARDLAIAVGIDARGIDETFLASYIAGLQPVCQRLGFGKDGTNALEAMLRAAGCPFEVPDLLAPVPAVPPPEGRAAARVRVAACAASVAEVAGQGLDVRELLERLGWAAESPDLAMAALRTLARRGEIVLPSGEGREVALIDTDARAAGEVWLRFVSDGYTARLFHDGNAALAHLSQHPAALVVTEVDLPGTSGIDLATALKSHPKMRGAHIFFLSREADPQVIMRGLQTGADDYLIKPANLDLLLIKAKRVLGP